MSKKENKKSGGARKYGRNRKTKRAVNAATSNYVKGVISFEAYRKQTS